MRCPSCDHDNRADRRFCAECGAALTVGCASCGAANQPGEKFCGGCGARLPTGAPPTGAPTPPPDPEATLPPGDRRQPTVLFCHLAGPTTPQPLLILADLSKRRVRAFIEELDAARVRVGQRAVVTADALPGRELTGAVSVVVPRMGKRSPQTDTPGEYKDLYFREMLIDLDGDDDVPPNLRVKTIVHVGSEP